MNQASAPLHAQFNFNHLALILSVALVLSAFLLITNPSSLRPVANTLSFNTQTTTFYNEMYADASAVAATTVSSTPALAAAPATGSVAGVQTVLLRGPVQLRGQP